MESRRNSRAILRLKQYDFAFVKRSDMTWSYAILADKRKKNVLASSDKTEEVMLFVIARNGRTKSISRRHWEKYILCIKDCENSSSDDSYHMEDKSRLMPRNNITEDHDDSFIGIDTHRPSHDDVERPSSTVFIEESQKSTSHPATKSLGSMGSVASGKRVFGSPPFSSSATRLRSNPLSSKGRHKNISKSPHSNHGRMWRSEDYSVRSKENSVYWA